MFWKKDKKDEVWLRGFEEGFSKAWDWIRPFMQTANEKLKKSLYEEAMSQAVKDLEPTIQNRIRGKLNGDS